jgi:putative peptide zinc metalloprotease protein
VVARHAAPVRKGEIVVECEDPLLRASVDVMRAQLGELRARYDAEILTNRGEAKIIAEGISHAAANLARAEERAAELTIRSPAEGILLLPGRDDLPGRFLTQGSLVAYVLDADRPTVRVVVPQSAVDLIRKRAKSVEVRIADRLGQVLSAVLQREIPGAVERLPSPVLGSMGGGAIAIDPSDKNGTKTLEKMFQFDIQLDAVVDRVDVGQRVYVRFDHGYEPLVFRWYRDLRRLFLRQFNV